MPPPCPLPPFPPLPPGANPLPPRAPVPAAKGLGGEEEFVGELEPAAGGVCAALAPAAVAARAGEAGVGVGKVPAVAAVAGGDAVAGGVGGGEADVFVAGDS